MFPARATAYVFGATGPPWLVWITTGWDAPALRHHGSPASLAVTRDATSGAKNRTYRSSTQCPVISDIRQLLGFSRPVDNSDVTLRLVGPAANAFELLLAHGCLRGGAQNRSARLSYWRTCALTGPAAV